MSLKQNDIFYEQMAEECVKCGGKGYIISDSYDHIGDHIQQELKCECQLGNYPEE